MADKTLFERAYEMGLKVEEKATGLQAEVVKKGSTFYLDDGSQFISPITEYTESDFWIVNE